MNEKTYILRREKLRKTVGSGVIVLFANELIGRNYKGNPYPFRQDSSFLYFTGLNIPGAVAILDCDSNTELLAGYNPTIEDAIWSGPQKSLDETAVTAGFKTSLPLGNLQQIISEATKKGRDIHFLPPYRAERKLFIANLLDKSMAEIDQMVSKSLINAVVEQREIKSKEEVAEIESALNLVTGPMHHKAMQMARQGTYEYEIVAKMSEMASAKNMEYAYSPICSVRGETLHNESHSNRLSTDQLLLVDAGVENTSHYASDITRTTPINGKFSLKQKEIYTIVLNAQLKAIEQIKPGILYRDIHLLAAEEITRGLIDLGLMKGNAGEAAAAGAHALFFPHGLGHMLGLDVHDMEDLGENAVGYGDKLKRSDQFGTAYLRLAKELQQGFVLTVEPGIYFIPPLIAQWKQEKMHEAFINYPALEGYSNFGGVRIEDNILVTSSDYKLLGDPIVKHPDEIEQLCGS